MNKITHCLLVLLKRFAQNQSGSIVTLIAFAIIPMITVVALGVDISRAYMVKSRLSSALDAASLAGGRAFYLDHRDDDIHMLFNANYPSGYMDSNLSTLTIDVDWDEETIYLYRTATIQTTFLQLIDIDELTVSAEAEIHRRKTALDLVLAIDMSGSMTYSASGGGTRIEAARAASHVLLDTLFGSDASKEYLTVGLVPWNSKVNVQIDGSTYDSDLNYSTPVTSFDNPVTGISQSEVYFADNSPVPFLHEPDPDWQGCVYARYLDDGDDNNDADIYDGLTTLTNGEWRAWEPIGPEGEPVSGGTCTSSINGSECIPCLSHGITPLQNTKSVIEDAVDDLLYPTGATNIAGGLGWAWRTLTPPTPFTEALEDPAVERTRAIVLLTDGAQVGGNGDAYKGTLGIGSSARANMDERLRDLATEIKSSGVVIYTIQFAYNNSSLQNLMKDVASGPDSPYYHFAPDRDSLETIFLEVANHVSELRLSK
ncbi:TadE/TadG family type IV pilus assembly protein [Curvivirga aplysinae]|uniref:TadE/TadG family type IV pilus assembly protein n=1 Tax=Curvivirga aplysinae TaxID=2529852 RepID=UPI0012BBB16A|nr:TadE/TadG family type IV pilus assembly protein [Curvivirga aplysinae]MTI08239.1 VWA domain-containing protein [Curvivirga aplysinae]